MTLLTYTTRRILLVLALVATLTVSRSQDVPTDMPHAHAREMFPEALYLNAQSQLPTSFDAIRPTTTTGAPFNVVYGWYPYWTSSSATTTMRPNLLTHIAWFSVGVDTATGALGSLDAWKNTQVVTWAKSKGLKVHLTITCFGSTELRALLGSDARRARCIAEITAAVNLRQADGVNIDFEGLPSSQRASMVSFMQALRKAMPLKELTMATPSVDWSKSWDLATLSTICDFLILMGYDYYWSGSSTAGPVAPLRGETYTVAKSIDAHLNAGVDPSRLVVAVPLYGRTWTVSTTARKADVISGTTSATPTYSSSHTLQGFSLRTHDEATAVSWFNNQDGAIVKQTWIDDSLSLEAKYRHIKDRGLRGVGFWALGYDGGRSSMWDGLQSMTTSTCIRGDAAEVASAADDQQVEIFTLLGQRVFAGARRDMPSARLPSGCYLEFDGRRSVIIQR
jgi:spore germination protein YaaH